jgi:hypothetical protein
MPEPIDTDLLIGRFDIHRSTDILRRLPEEIIGVLADVQPVDVLRPLDLVSIRFSFVNLRLVAGDRGSPPTVRRRVANRPAFLIATFPSQHITERAFYQQGKIKPKPQQTDAQNGTAKVTDPDENTGQETPEPPPVFASVAGPTRLVFRVTTQTIPYTAEGLLESMRRLDLSVAPHARRPEKPRLVSIDELIAEQVVDLAVLLRAVPRSRRIRTARAAEVQPGTSARLAGLGRLISAGIGLEQRFGTLTAAAAIAGTTLGQRLELEKVIDLGPILEAKPRPQRPSDTETSIELPWRLAISPHDRAAWAHSLEPVERAGRIELWHSRLGVRASADDTPVVDEHNAELRTIRAVWARDFDELAGFPFAHPPTAKNFPNADRSQDRPRDRMSLNSRDRMMLVHETSNFQLKRGRRDWVPPAVPVNHLMLSALGGWLDSELHVPNLPDGGLTIEEWKHRAAMARDHEVKVVYAGFLMPWGHRASLVKITERKISDKPGRPAYLFQRVFIIVREPVKQFRSDARVHAGRRLDLAMPFSSVRILTRVTPDLEDPTNLLTSSGGLMFAPKVAGARLPFRMLAVDLEGNVLEFAAPLVFLERDRNVSTQLGTETTPGKVVRTYNELGTADRSMALNGQRLAFAESQAADDTTLETAAVQFHVAAPDFLKTLPQDNPRFVPMLDQARAVVPAISALAGTAAPVALRYPDKYASSAFSGNAAQVFLETAAGTTTPLDFSNAGDRSGGFVTPSLAVTGLSRLTGPIGGKIDDAVNGRFKPKDFFAGISAKLFGVVRLADLLAAVPFDPGNVPRFAAQTFNVVTVLIHNVERLRDAAQQHASELGSAATDLRERAGELLADVVAFTANPTGPVPDLESRLTAVRDRLVGFDAAVESASALSLATRQQLRAVVSRVREQLADAAAVTAAVARIRDFVGGLELPEVLTAQLDWTADLPPYPANLAAAPKPNDWLFAPHGPAAADGHPRSKLTLAVEVQAPTAPDREPTVMVACSIAPFDLRLIGSSTFLILHFEQVEFAIRPGQKPDVNVVLRERDGVEFAGPLKFVDTLRQIIPFDSFSDPPYLDITADGITSGLDLAVPSLAVGVFTLENVSFGAHFRVPFIDESLDVRFNFCSRENPFRLTVMIFGGGGFFAVTLTPDGVRVLEAAFEFGAAISVNFGVASGGVSVLAGIYFRLEGDDATLTGYFQLRGEVSVLGLISASIELYLELTYETATKKAVGRATLTIEVSILFLSFSVQISCERKFAGANSDPTFIDMMDVPPLAPAGTTRPWDSYCRAFADA